MLEDVLVPIISIIPENPKLISCFTSSQPLMIKEPESKTSNSFTQLASYLMGQSFHINNKGFVSWFIDGIIGNFPIKSNDIKILKINFFLKKSSEKVFFH